MRLKENPEDFIVKEEPNISLTPKGKYLIYELKKKLWNTEDAVQKISKELKIPRRNIGYAGSKDRNAVTTQFISILNVKKEKISKLKIKDIKLKYVGKSQKPLSLGDLFGNTFEITARNCKKKPKEILFIINYFGEQRFSKNNAKIGKAIIKKDFKKACKLIKNKKLKEHLKDNKNDYIGALKKVPLKTATLYIRAYQSLLWNEVADSLRGRSISIPMIGFATKLGGEPKQVYEEIMEEEKINLKDFIIRSWPELSAEGAERKLYIPMEKIKIKKIKKGVYKLKFFLPRGCYATVAVKQIFDPIHPDINLVS